LIQGRVHFHVGAGIVADSSPEAEHDETMAKAGGFLDCLRAASASHKRGGDVSSPVILNVKHGDKAVPTPRAK
jgi:hypothetical protein